MEIDLKQNKKKKLNSFFFYFEHNSLHSQPNLVAKKSIIKPTIAHSKANQKGENQSYHIDDIIANKSLYINNASTKFNQAQKKTHLNQKGILQVVNTGCLSITHIIHIIPHKVVYQNNIPNLSFISTSQKKYGIHRNHNNQIIKPIVLAINNLLAILLLNIIL